MWCLLNDLLRLIESMLIALHLSTIESRMFEFEPFILEYNLEQPFVFKFTSIFKVLFLGKVSNCNETSFHSNIFLYFETNVVIFQEIGFYSMVFNKFIHCQGNLSWT